jgi:hypothetical protein
LFVIAAIEYQWKEWCSRMMVYGLRPCYQLSALASYHQERSGTTLDTENIPGNFLVVPHRSLGVASVPHMHQSKHGNAWQKKRVEWAFRKLTISIKISMTL